VSTVRPLVDTGMNRTSLETLDNAYIYL